MQYREPWLNKLKNFNVLDVIVLIPRHNKNIKICGYLGDGQKDDNKEPHVANSLDKTVATVEEDAQDLLNITDDKTYIC